MAKYSNIVLGDFTSLQVSEVELEMLQDGYQAVTKADQWSYLRGPNIPGTRGCPHCEGNKDCSGKITNEFKCFCTGNCRVCQGKGELENGFARSTAQLDTIDKYMKYTGHSGSSYSWTMSNMDYIAKKGWPAYVALKGVKSSPLRTLATTLSFAASAPKDLTAFANAIQKDPAMREQIPYMDEQVAGIHQYVKAVEDAQKDPSTWKKSAGFPYPCSCHRAQGKEGWCGVAGFGVPACDH